MLLINSFIFEDLLSKKLLPKSGNVRLNRKKSKVGEFIYLKDSLRKVGLKVKNNIFQILAQCFLITLFLVTLTSALVINEFTVDPKTDWDGSGNATSSDEWFELYNSGNSAINLSGWVLVLNDSIDESQLLEGIIQPNGYFIILNPTGIQNNDGQLILYNALGGLVDSLAYGNWNDSNLSDNAPDGNSNNQLDECLARIPNGIDTNMGSNDFVKTSCTFGTENGLLPSNQQELNVTIASAITFQVLPRNLEFGLVQPGSQNNPALNGPIVFNITGSTTNVNVEITEVTGFPFEQGLKIDNEPALGKFWTILYSSPIKTAIPTLDIPKNAPAGNNKGTIVYTVTGII